MKHLAAILTALSLVACSGRGGDTSNVDNTLNPYDDGRRAAAEMVAECTDSVAVQDFLLEFQADTYQVELSHGTEAAAERRHGFETAVRELDPDLAATIF